MKTITQTVLEQLKQQGLESRIVPARHAQDLQNLVEGEYSLGHFAEDFYRERLQFYQFSLPEDLPAAKSIVVVAMPRPQTPVRFALNGDKITLTLPPTYARYTEITYQIGEILRAILAPAGYHVAGTQLPLKLLAACSGLTEYGRNNIGYIPGMGSFFQLSAYYSDLPADVDSWQEPHMMERCKTCQACLKKCPTGAIGTDRFLLHAERCLVFHNERGRQYPFPAWIEPEMHNCLIGCMLCQRYCPEDKPFLAWFEDPVDFSNEETNLLLKASRLEDLPAETIRKLEALDLSGYLEQIPRNLSAFIQTGEDVQRHWKVG